jgi:MFS family permease
MKPSTQRVVMYLRWLPPVAALAYAFVLVRRLPDVVDQLTWNADYVSVMALAQSIGSTGKAGHAIIVQIGYFWLDLAALPLPFGRFIWLYAPYAMALLALLLLAWTAGRLSGRFAALLTASLGLAASPLVLSTQAAESYHGTTWFGTALLAAFLCWLLTSHPGRISRVAVAVIVALLVGFATATDPLLGPVGDAPFAAALLAAWLVRRNDVEKPALVTGLGALVLAGAVAVGIVLTDRVQGYTSSFPRGLTHLVPREHLALHMQQLASGLFEVAGMPREGSALGVVLGLLLICSVLLPIALLIRSVRGQMRAPLLAVIGFWSASALFLAGAFVFSDVPSDFVENSARYLVPMFYVAVATVPLWAAADPRRLAAIAVPASLFILANTAAVEHDARTGAFESSFSFELPKLVSFLEQQGLTHGYAAYDEASPMTVKSDFQLKVRPVTEQFLTQDDKCGQPICPYAYNSVSDWYVGGGGPTFIIIDPEMVRLSQPPPDSLEVPTQMLHTGRFVIYVYADDVATHMGMPRKFTRPLL